VQRAVAAALRMEHLRVGLNAQMGASATATATAIAAAASELWEPYIPCFEAYHVHIGSASSHHSSHSMLADIQRRMQPADVVGSRQDGLEQ
jgi:hypothetical protein